MHGWEKSEAFWSKGKLLQSKLFFPNNKKKNNQILQQSYIFNDFIYRSIHSKSFDFPKDQ